MRRDTRSEEQKRADHLMACARACNLGSGYGEHAIRFGRALTRKAVTVHERRLWRQATEIIGGIKEEFAHADRMMGGAA